MTTHNSAYASRHGRFHGPVALANQPLLPDDATRRSHASHRPATHEVASLEDQCEDSIDSLHDLLRRIGEGVQQIDDWTRDQRALNTFNITKNVKLGSGKTWQINVNLKQVDAGRSMDEGDAISSPSSSQPRRSGNTYSKTANPSSVPILAQRPHAPPDQRTPKAPTRAPEKAHPPVATVDLTDEPVNSPAPASGRSKRTHSPQAPLTIGRDKLRRTRTATQHENVESHLDQDDDSPVEEKSINENSPARPKQTAGRRTFVPKAPHPTIPLSTLLDAMDCLDILTDTRRPAADLDQAVLTVLHPRLEVLRHTDVFDELQKPTTKTKTLCLFSRLLKQKAEVTELATCCFCQDNSFICVQIDKGQRPLLVPMPEDAREGCAPTQIGYWTRSTDVVTVSPRFLDSQMHLLMLA